MSKEILDFQREMDRAFKKIKKKSERVVKATFTEMFTNIVDDTPFGRPELWASFPSVPKNYVPGTLKANWITAIGTLPTDFNPNAQDVSGLSSIAKMRNTVSIWNQSKPLYFANNAPYAEAIEFGASTQASPYAMYRNNVRRFEEILNKNAKREARKDG